RRPPHVPAAALIRRRPARCAPSPPRTMGGRAGYPKQGREPFAAEQVTSFAEHALDACPCCGGALRPSGALPQVVQQVDILPARWTIEQHTCPEYWCGQCQKAFKAPLPLHVEKGGLVGPHLTALIAYLKGVCHASFSTVRKYLRDVVGVTLSRGQLSKIVGKVARALEQPYAELLALLPSVAVAQVDETGHKDNGKPWWTWCFRT